MRWSRRRAIVERSEYGSRAFRTAKRPRACITTSGAHRSPRCPLGCHATPTAAGRHGEHRLHQCACTHSQVTNIGAAGGTATDSHGLLEVSIPPGALTLRRRPFGFTPMAEREELPRRFPHTTMTTYGFSSKPDGTQFAQRSRVRVTNSRNLPTSMKIPVGLLRQARRSLARRRRGASGMGRSSRSRRTHFST